MKHTGRPSSFGLENHGLDNLVSAHWNLSIPALYEHSLRRGESELAAGGGLVVTTGEYTGRSPKDKYIADRKSTFKHRNQKKKAKLHLCLY